MAPPNTRGKQPETASASTEETIRVRAPDYDVAMLQAQIQELLEARAVDQAQNQDLRSRLNQVLDRMEPLSRNPTPVEQGTPVQQDRPLPSMENTLAPAIKQKSAKIPDPTPFSNGVNPTFENWRIQIIGKFRVNADHFDSEEAKMYYLFGRTMGDAQEHLQPRFDDDAADAFESYRDMLDHLAGVYREANREENARLNYRSLRMKRGQTFSEFYTQFLQLAGKGGISKADYRPDLYEKITTELQRMLLPVYSAKTTYQEVAKECISLDQGLKRIQEREDRRKRFRENKSVAPTQSATARAPPTPQKAGTSPVALAAVDKAIGKETPERPRPQYDNSRKQQLSSTGSCFNCEQQGHMAKDCPKPRRLGFVNEIEVDESLDSGKEEL